MPLYTFFCSKCNTDVDVKRSFNESSTEAICEICNSVMTRQWNQVGVVFNGSGFYSTDNRKK